MDEDPLDLVAIRGIQAHGYHGVFPEERRDGQSFVVDLVVALDSRPAAGLDALSLTVDYGNLANQVVHAIQGEPVNLLETLAQRIADLALTGPARWVQVTVHKPQAPIAVPFDDVTVSIRRSSPADRDPPEGST